MVTIRITNPVWAGDSFRFFRLRFTASGIQESTPGGFPRRRLALTAKIRILRCPKRRAIAGLAQLVEQLVYTEWVGGSNPSLRTTRFIGKSLFYWYFLCSENERPLRGHLPNSVRFRENGAFLATVLATAPGLLSFCCRVYTKDWGKACFVVLGMEVIRTVR